MLAKHMRLMFMFLCMSKMKGIIFPLDFHVNICGVLWSFGFVGTIGTFVRTHWGHAIMSKCCMYAIDGSKNVLNWFQSQSKKYNQFCEKPSLKPRKIVKDGKNRTRHVNVGVPPFKLKTLVENCFASKIIRFQETFEFKNVIAFCYGM